MMEFLALNCDMRPDSFGGFGRVTFFKRSHDLFVLLHRLFQAAPETQLSSTEWLKSVL